jgi:hypothetical protein
MGLGGRASNFLDFKGIVFAPSPFPSFWDLAGDGDIPFDLKITLDENGKVVRKQSLVRDATCSGTDLRDCRSYVSLLAMVPPRVGFLFWLAKALNYSPIALSLATLDILHSDSAIRVGKL